MNLIPLKPYGLKTITLNHDRLNIAFVDIDGTLTNDSRRKEQYLNDDNVGEAYANYQANYRYDNPYHFLAYDICSCKYDMIFLVSNRYSDALAYTLSTLRPDFADAVYMAAMRDPIDDKDKDMITLKFMGYDLILQKICKMRPDVKISIDIYDDDPAIMDILRLADNPINNLDGLKLDRSQFLLVNKGNIINRILFKE